MINPVEKMDHFLVVVSNIRVLRLDPITSLNALFQSALDILIQAQRPDEVSHETVESNFGHWVVVVIDKLI